MEKFLTKFYLDKEKDIIITLYKNKDESLRYILETPNHGTGNLITNLARICGLETTLNENGMKIIEGVIDPFINSDGLDVYILKLGSVEVATIYADGKIEQKAKIPAIIKILMSQTKDYKLGIESTIVNSYIPKKIKLRTDLHTHMNAILQPDVLIALGIKHQIRYPLYFVRKINLTLTEKQEEKIEKYRKEVEAKYIDSELEGKKLDRKIKDETYINFADLILNNLENAEENIRKIRKSLYMIKDGQAVFTNLEKLYLYRYVFCKAKESKIKIEIDMEKVEQIPENDIKRMLKQMYLDASPISIYKNNTILQDKLLWIAREYKKQGIVYAEIANTDFTKKGDRGVQVLEEIHQVMPNIEEETGVSLRFLIALRRVLLTPDAKIENQILEDLDVLKAIAKSPYIVGSDIIGEEVNDIRIFEPIIKEITRYVTEEDEEFTIRIHAGENDAYKDNVENAVLCVEKSVPKGKKIPNFRIGHGLYINDLSDERGKKLIKKMRELGAVLEFQLSSNVRLNNLTEIKNHPIKKYIRNGVKCVQGTDGCGFYGIDTLEEQMALRNLLKLDDTDFEMIKDVEDEIIKNRKEYFIKKSEKFKEFLDGRSIRNAILDLEEKNFEASKNSKMKIKLNNTLDSSEVLKNKITKLPENKFPVIIAGGSFNGSGRKTVIDENGKKMLKDLLEKLNNEKVYFVIGHKMEGYEKAILDISKELNKKFEIDAIVPKMVSSDIRDEILKEPLNGVCISPECEELGIYKSFNYEIFERRKSVVVAFDGNSPVLNLVQEAKNGKGKAKIYVNADTNPLKEKAKSLEGYVSMFNTKDNLVDLILKDNPELNDKIG